MNGGLKIRFGRQARAFNPGIPHMSALKFGFGKPAVPLPPSKDYAPPTPNFGMMLNDTLGDCTCAAYYHARQVWSFNAKKKIVTEPDSDVELLYEKAAGYKPNAKPRNGQNPTDKGAQEQTILKYLYKTGAPVGPKGTKRDKILGFVEVNPHNQDDMKRTIFDCGLAYIGFVVPQSWTQGPPPKVWDFKHGDGKSQDGHAVILTGYDGTGYNVISWGEKYRMTLAFVNEFVDEAYGIADNEWFGATGSSPLGMTRAQLKQIMKSL